MFLCDDYYYYYLSCLFKMSNNTCVSLCSPSLSLVRLSRPMLSLSIKYSPSSWRSLLWWYVLLTVRAGMVFILCTTWLLMPNRHIIRPSTLISDIWSPVHSTANITIISSWKINVTLNIASESHKIVCLTFQNQTVKYKKFRSQSI